MTSAFTPFASAAALAVALTGATAMATERATYTTVARYEDFEVRSYPAQLVAETLVEGRPGDAGNVGFRRLAGYIFGGNRGQQSIAMTAPVTQLPDQRQAMNTPGSQTAATGESYVIQFAMPADLTLGALPEPNDDRVTLRVIPPRTVAVRTYSGRWSDTLYLKHLTTLREALSREGLAPRGPPTWARYDPPWMPWFFRTNEIHFELETPAAVAPEVSASGVAP